jgi:hypothetical protein
MRLPHGIPSRVGGEPHHKGRCGWSLGGLIEAYSIQSGLRSSLKIGCIVPWQLAAFKVHIWGRQLLGWCCWLARVRVSHGEPPLQESQMWNYVLCFPKGSYHKVLGLMFGIVNIKIFVLKLTPSEHKKHLPIMCENKKMTFTTQTKTSSQLWKSKGDLAWKSWIKIFLFN